MTEDNLHAGSYRKCCGKKALVTHYWRQKFGSCVHCCAARDTLEYRQTIYEEITKDVVDLKVESLLVNDWIHHDGVSQTEIQSHVNMLPHDTGNSNLAFVFINTFYYTSTHFYPTARCWRCLSRVTGVPSIWKSRRKKIYRLRSHWAYGHSR